MINAIVYGNPQEMYNAIRGKYGTHELEIAKSNTKGVKVRLIDAISQDQTFNLPIINDKGKRVYRPVKFSPNTLYKVPDDNFLEILQIRGLTKKKYSVELEEALKKAECIRKEDGEAFFADDGHAGMIKRGYVDQYFPQKSKGRIWRIK